MTQELERYYLVTVEYRGLTRSFGYVPLEAPNKTVIKQLVAKAHERLVKGWP